MRRSILPAVVLTAATALMLMQPPAADAQTPRGERGPRGARAAAPMERIIELREELGLTDTQVTELRGIQTRLAEQNAPLLERLAAAREAARAERQEMTAEEREQMREQRRERMRERREAGEAGRPRAGGRGTAIPEELRPVMEQLRENRRAALEQVRSTLTADQQLKLRELRRAHRPGPESRGAERRTRGPAGGATGAR